MSNLLVLAASGAGGGDLAMIGVLLVIMIGFYVVMFRKQNKEQKAHGAMVGSLEAGDSIVTTSGFYGVIIGKDDEHGFVTVEFGGNKNCRINMKKEAIAEVEKTN